MVGVKKKRIHFELFKKKLGVIKKNIEEAEKFYFIKNPLMQQFSKCDHQAGSFCTINEHVRNEHFMSPCEMYSLRHWTWGETIFSQAFHGTLVHTEV